MRYLPKSVGSRLLIGVTVLLATHAAASAEAVSPLDPRQYLEVYWNEHELVKPCETETPSCAREWEVIGTDGDLRIDFVRDHIKELWDFKTSGELTMQGYVVPVEEGKDRRAFEIPGYSVVGEELEVVPLDLSRAFDLVVQMEQGSVLADRFTRADKSAELAALKAKESALAALITAQEELLRVTEDALRRVYGAALAFRLGPEHLKRTAADIQVAEEALTSLPRPAQAARAARLRAFFDEVEVNQAVVAAWLGGVLSEENAPYLPVIGHIVGRDADVIRKVAMQVEERIAEANLDLSEEARIGTMESILANVKVLVSIQTAVYEKYRTLNDVVRRGLLARRQVQDWIPSGFDPKNLEPPTRFLASSRCLPTAAEFKPGPLDTRDLEALAESKARDRLADIETLLKELTGAARLQKVSEKAVKNFTAQILEVLEQIEDLRVKKAALAKSINEADDEVKRWDEARKNRECERTVLENRRGIEALLMFDVLDELIDRIRPVTLSLATLDLQEGDRVVLQVSLIPGTTDQTTVDFQAAPWGWRGPKPRIKDVVTFVQADAPAANFAPSPSVNALWNFYGRSKKLNSKLRTLAPGVGISAAFLDFDDDESTIEVGLGLAVSFFDDLVHLTYGYNLQKKAPPAMAGLEGSREYWGIGVSISQVLKKVSGEGE